MENFDMLASTWDNDSRRIERAKVVANEILQAIPSTDAMVAMEYGCGTGLLSFNLHTFFKRITLADNSEGMLKVLTKKINDANITNMRPLRLDLAEDVNYSNKFDVIYTLMTLHHIIDIDMVLDGFSKLLNPAGYLCIADLDKEDGTFHGDGFIGHNGFEKGFLENKLLKYGFSIVSYKICYQNIIKHTDGTERKYPTFHIVGQK